MKNVEYCGRQGDVYLYRVAEFPEGNRKQDALTKKQQLALGELSGHNHYFDDSSAVDLFKLDGFEGLTFIDVKKDTPLIHGLIKGFKGTEADQDYHSSVTMKQGKYITGIVEETDWMTRTIRQVID